MKIFAVHDKAVDAFLQPFFAPARGSAIRSFVDACTDSNHQFAKHLDDYVLYELGSFDDGNAQFSTHEPQRVMSGFDVISVTGDTVSMLRQAQRE